MTRAPVGASSRAAAPRRIVHLVDAATAGGAALAAACIADLAAASPQRHLLLLAGGAAERSACRRAGCPPIATVTPPIGEAVLARRLIRAALRRSDAAALVTWGVGALAVGLGLPMPIAFAATVGPSPGIATTFARRRLRSAWIPAVAFDSGVARDVESTLGLPAEVVPAPIDRSRIERDRRAIREQWGADDETLCLGFLADPPRWSDARRAADAVGVPRVRGARVRLIVHPDAARLAATRRWLEELKLADLLVVDPRVSEPWGIVAGLDAALLGGDGLATCGSSADGDRRVTGDEPWAPWSLAPRSVSPLPGLWARAAGVPTFDAERPLGGPHGGRRVELAREVLEAWRALSRRGLGQERSVVGGTTSLETAARAMGAGLRLPVA